MHQKKSELQIGTGSNGISSDYFNPTLQILIKRDTDENDPFALKPTTPFKRPQFSSSLTKTGTLSNSVNKYAVLEQTHFKRLNFFHTKSHIFLSHFNHHFRHFHRILKLHIRLILLLTLPFLYFLVSQPSTSILLDFLSAFAFSTALLVSLNLAIPRLPTIRLFLANSFPNIKKGRKDDCSHLPVFWSIGSRQKIDKKSLSGCFVEAYRNGDVYEGEFHKGKCNGSGVYYYYMSGRYEGDWIDEKYDGYGVEIWARGSRYRGQYTKGLRHGVGVYRFHTGDVYAGEWCNGQGSGCGVHTCDDGSRYVGEFKLGVKHGLGHYHFRNGDRYAGEYFADKMHGFGVYYFANGHRYEGAWHEGRKQGLGVYTFRDNETQSGHWQNGTLDVPSIQTSNSVYPFVVNHSKVINVVQEAQRAAAKAYKVSKVDERVNRAVVAANKSASAARVAAVKAVQKQMHFRRNSDELPVPLV